MALVKSSKQYWGFPSSSISISTKKVFKSSSLTFSNITFFLSKILLTILSSTSTKPNKAHNNTFFSSISLLAIIIFYHKTPPFTIRKRARKKADQESQLPIGIFSYSSSFLHSISVPSRKTTNNVPSSKTLMWSSVFSMKSVSISVKGFAPSVYSINFSAR